MRIIYDDLGEFSEVIVRCTDTRRKSKCSYCPFFDRCQIDDDAGRHVQCGEINQPNSSCIPAAGVESVVYCKHCIYYETGKDHKPYCNHMNGLDDVKPNDFCSLGEKRAFDNENK